jgi:hypothetical protein
LIGNGHENFCGDWVGVIGRMRSNTNDGFVANRLPDSISRGALHAALLLWRPMMRWLLDRLKERSTWLAIFTFAGLVGMKVEPELRELIINAILGIAAVAAFIWREHRDPNERTRATDIPEIDLVGRSESTDVPCDSDARPVIPDRITLESLERMRESQLPSDIAIQPEERGSGWNG